MAEFTVELRKCKKCGVEKPLRGDNFKPFSKSVGSGYTHVCVLCIRQVAREKRLEKIEECRARARAAYYQNREKILAQHKNKWRESHPQRRQDKEIKARLEIVKRGTLTCNSCGENKSLSFFRLRTRGNASIAYYEKKCKKCINEQSARWRELDLDETNRKARIYYNINKEKINLARRGVGNIRYRLRRARLKVNFTPISSVEIDNLLSKQKHRCAICKRQLKKFHVDHIMPLARGGAHEIRNLQILCPKCNGRKHARHPIDHMQKLGFLL